MAAQFAGAVATPEFILYFDYFIRKDYGDEYLEHLDEVLSPDWVIRKRTLRQKIHDYFEQVTYSINQPAAARDYQSCFWNIAYFDKSFFDGMFGDFLFPMPFLFFDFLTTKKEVLSEKSSNFAEKQKEHG